MAVMLGGDLVHEIEEAALLNGKREDKIELVKEHLVILFLKYA